MPFADIDQLTVLLLILVGSLLLGIMATYLFRSTVPAMLGKFFNTEVAEAKYLDLLKEGYVVRDRVRALQEELSQLELSFSRQDTESRKLVKQIATIRNKVPDFIHEIGDPREGCHRYCARLSVDNSSQYLRSTSEVYNPMWHHTNVVDIWAETRDEARKILEIAFSEKLGYQKTMIDTPVKSQEGASR